MPTKLGLTKFTSGKIDFNIGEEGQKRFRIQADLTDLENLQPLRDAINASTTQTGISAELQEVTGDKGVYKTCILSSEKENIAFDFPEETSKEFGFLAFQPGLLNAKNLSDLGNAILIMRNSEAGLKVENPGFEIRFGWDSSDSDDELAVRMDSDSDDDYDIVELDPNNSPVASPKRNGLFGNSKPVATENAEADLVNAPQLK